MQLKPIIKEALPLIKKEIRISGFWKKGEEVKKLGAALEDIIYSIAGDLDLDPVIDKAGKISTEMLALAKIRHSRLVKDARI